MPVNKAARFRFDILDECLRNARKKWTKAELLRHVNRRLAQHYGDSASISLSQLRYDLESLETEFGAPIIMYREGRSYYYRYEDPAFSLHNIPVEEDDLRKLGDAVALLQQISGFTIAEEIGEIVSRLESRYRYSGSGQSIIAFEDSPPMQGIENLEDIYHAILNQTPLKLTYQTFREEKPRIFHLHPYLLKEYSHRWYLLGYCEEKAGIIILALDRLHEIRVSKSPFIPNTFVDAHNYFRDLIGVTLYSGQSAQIVELLFSGEMAPYIRTKPLHRSQEILHQHEDGRLHISISVYLNPELTNLLLSYGRNVQVLQPGSLAEIMHQTARETFLQYETVG